LELGLDNHLKIFKKNAKKYLDKKLNNLTKQTTKKKQVKNGKRRTQYQRKY